MRLGPGDLLGLTAVEFEGSDDVPLRHAVRRGRIRLPTASDRGTPHGSTPQPDHRPLAAPHRRRHASLAARPPWPMEEVVARARVAPGAPTCARRLLPLLAVVWLVGGLGGGHRRDTSRPGAPDHRDQLRFMWAMAGQESGWDYYARNSSSGAFGKYQIMPFNWPVWAGQYLGDARADQTPYNQEKVAYGKLRDLYRWLGSWKRVAYWWLTGRTDRNEKRWSSYAKGYVDNIMRLRKRAPAGGVGHAGPDQLRVRARATGGARAASSGCASRSAAGPGPQRGQLRRWPGAQGARVSRTHRQGERWIRVVTADGRLGWLKQLRTVPAHRPARRALARRQGPRASRAAR